MGGGAFVVLRVAGDLAIGDESAETPFGFVLKGTSGRNMHTAHFASVVRIYFGHGEEPPCSRTLLIVVVSHRSQEVASPALRVCCDRPPRMGCVWRKQFGVPTDCFACSGVPSLWPSWKKYKN